MLLAPIALAQVVADGGNITQVNLTIFNETTVWQGLSGTIVFVGPNFLPNLTAEGGEVNNTALNFTSLCSNPSATGFIFYSNSTATPTGLVAGNLTQLDNFLNTGADSANNTFTTNSTFNIGGPITNVPTTFTYVNNASQSTVFREGYFNDAAGNIVFAVEINLNTQGYNSSSFDFQAILPTEDGNPTSFYLTSNIQIVCPVTPAVGGGSNTGYSACIANWVCSNWGPCINNLQTRTCKASLCGRAITRPPESKTCDSPEPPETEEPQIIASLQSNPPTIKAPSEINVLATRIHTVPITITNNLPYSIENLHAKIETDITTQQYKGLYQKPKLYELFGVLLRQNNFGEHKISSQNIPLTLWPKETITIPLTIIGPPITPRTIQARLNTYSDELLLTTQPITIKTETPPFAFMRDTRQSTTTAYIIIDNRGKNQRKTDLEIDFNNDKDTMFADVATINLPANSITALSQTYRTMFDYNSMKTSSDGYTAEAK
jgi:hypothetical protein